MCLRVFEKVYFSNNIKKIPSWLFVRELNSGEWSIEKKSLIGLKKNNEPSDSGLLFVLGNIFFANDFTSMFELLLP